MEKSNKQKIALVTLEYAEETVVELQKDFQSLEDAESLYKKSALLGECRSLLLTIIDLDEEKLNSLYLSKNSSVEFSKKYEDDPESKALLEVVVPMFKFVLGSIYHLITRLDTEDEEQFKSSFMPIKKLGKVLCIPKKLTISSPSNRDKKKAVEVMFDENEKLRGATLEKLVEHATKTSSEEYYGVISLTYPTFTTAEKLLTALLKRFEEGEGKEAEKIKLNVAALTRFWVEKHIFPFLESSQLADTLNEFIEKGKYQTSTIDWALIYSRLRNLAGGEIHQSIRLIIQQKQKPDKGGKNPSFITESTPQVIAEQMTALEYEIMRSIKPAEFLKQAWNKKNSSVLAPNICYYIDWFNQRSRWFSTALLKEEDVEKRALLMEKFIEVGHVLYKFQNYNGVMQTLSCLNSSAISRLKNSWSLVTPKKKELFKELGDLMSPDGNFGAYRLAQSSAQPPYLPYIGMYLTDLTFIDDSNSDEINGLISVEKAIMTSKIIQEFQRGISTSYVPSLFGKDEAIQELLMSTAPYEESDLYRISLLLEARTGGTMKKTSRKFSLARTPSSVQKSQTELIQSDLTPRDWQLLLAGGIENSYAENDFIITEEKMNDALYKVLKGSVRVEKNIGGENRVVATLGVDAYFGETAVMGKYGTATASVISNGATVARMSVEFLKTIFVSEPDLAQRFYTRLSVNLAKKLKELPNPGGAMSNNSPAVSTKKQAPKEVDKKTLTKQTSKADITDDQKFNSMFKLTNEVIIKQYHASIKKKIHGKLFVSAGYLCYFSKLFGVKTKEKIAWANIQELTLDEKHKQIKISLAKGKTFKFTISGIVIKEAFNIMDGVWAGKRESSSIIDLKTETNETTEIKSDSEILTEDDWEQILRGAKPMKYQENSTIIEEGSKNQTMYQILSGSVKIEKQNSEGNPILLGEMQKGDMFGELSFLSDGEGASASVIAKSDDTELYVIEGYFVNLLFSREPAMAGHFYNYLAWILINRIRKREKQLK